MGPTLHRTAVHKLLVTSPKMEAGLAGNQDETSQPQQPQQTCLEAPPGLPQGEEYHGNSRLQGVSSVSLPDAVPAVTQPSPVLGGENDSSANLLRASAPFARSTPLASRPSLLSLDGADDTPNNTEPRRTISVKPSLVSLPESPEVSNGTGLSPVQSPTIVPNVAPVSPATATVPLAPAHDPGKWQSRIRGFKRSLGDFLVRSCPQLILRALTISREDLLLFNMERPLVSVSLYCSGAWRRRRIPYHDHHLR